MKSQEGMAAIRRALDMKVFHDKTFVHDMIKSIYENISSSGLRILLLTKKTMDKQGDMAIKNLSPEIREIFDITGFSRVMRII